MTAGTLAELKSSLARAHRLMKAGDPESCVHAARCIEAALDAAQALAAEDRVDSPRVQVRALGAFTVVVDGEPVPHAAWGSRRARQLLKMLVAGRGRPIARSILADRLWPWAPDDQRASARLSVLLSTVRRVLSGGVLTDTGGVALDLTTIDVDVEAFMNAAEEGRVQAAAALYAGDFLPEDLYDDWAIGARDQLRFVYLGLLRQLAAAATASGDHETAAAHSLRLLGHDPYDDDGHRRLVTSLTAAGRLGEARRAHARFADRLAEIGLQAPPLRAIGHF